MRSNTETFNVPPKLILINASYAPSLLTFRGKLIENLLSLGHIVHVSAPDIASSVAADLVAMGAVVHELRLERNGRNPFADAQYLYDLITLYRAIKPDLIIGYTIKPNIWGSIAASLYGIRSVSMVTGLGFSFSPDRPMRARIVQSLSRRLYAFATRANSHVVFQNPDDIVDFVAIGCLGDARKVLLVNGSGVDTDQFTPTPLPSVPVFLMIARFLESKGVREYAKAAMLVHERHPGCRFLMVGFPDEGVDGIAQHELDHWFASGVTNLGQLDDVRSAIAQSSVYVLPSYREGTPRTVLEAMAMGRAIITTDVPGCRETVHDRVNGLLVPVRNIPALADAMIALAQDAAMRANMGTESRKRALEKYAVEKVNAVLVGGLGLSR